MEGLCVSRPSWFVKKDCTWGLETNDGIGGTDEEIDVVLLADCVNVHML